MGGCHVCLSIAPAFRRKNRPLELCCGEGGGGAQPPVRGSPHPFQEEEAASDPQFCCRSVQQSLEASTRGWGKAECECLAAEMVEEAPSGPVNQMLFVFLRLSHCRVSCPCLRTFPCSRAALGQSPGSQPASLLSTPHKHAADKKDSCVHLGKKRGSTRVFGSIAQLQLHGNEMSRLPRSPCCVRPCSAQRWVRAARWSGGRAPGKMLCQAEVAASQQSWVCVRR